jgi:hypothetical protein
MYRPRYERVSRLRRFVSRRGKGGAGDLPSLIAEATRLLLLPSLRDVLGDEGTEPVELRLTYACACVVLAELLAQRFAPGQAEETAAGAMLRIGAWSGLDDARLTERASATIRQLMETHPEVHQRLCGQFDDAVERSIVLGRPAQGEVLVRLALESFETAIQQLVLGRGDLNGAGLIRSSGLLRVVTRREPAAGQDAADAGARKNGGASHAWPFAPLEQLLYRPARKAPAKKRTKRASAKRAEKRAEKRSEKRTEKRSGQQRRRLVTLTGLVDRWRRADEPREDPQT